MDPFERLRYVARRGSGGASVVAAEAAPALAALAGEPGALLTATRRLLDFHPVSGPLWWMAAQLLVASDPELAAAFATAELEEDPTEQIAAAAVAGRAPATVAALAEPGEHLFAVLVAARPPVVRFVAEPWSQRRLMTRFSAAVERGERDEPTEHEEREHGEREDRPARRRRRQRERGAGGPPPDVSGWDPEDADEALDGSDLALVDVLAAGPTGVVTPPGGIALARAAARRRVPLWGVGGAGRVLPEALFDLLVARLDTPRAAGELVPASELTSYVGPAGAGDPGTSLASSDCPVPVELLRRAR